jgi:hypothetical protein
MSYVKTVISFLLLVVIILALIQKQECRFSWSYPVRNNLKGYLLISHGYGETLIDYNNLQTTVGWCFFN